jgi:hypothetical protein
MSAMEAPADMKETSMTMLSSMTIFSPLGERYARHRPASGARVLPSAPAAGTSRSPRCPGPARDAGLPSPSRACLPRHGPPAAHRSGSSHRTRRRGSGHGRQDGTRGRACRTRPCRSGPAPGTGSGPTHAESRSATRRTRRGWTHAGRPLRPHQRNPLARLARCPGARCPDIPRSGASSTRVITNRLPRGTARRGTRNRHRGGSRRGPRACRRG